MEQALAAYSGLAFRSGTSITAEWRIRHGDGAWRHIEVVANNLLGDPTVEGIVLTLRDVTERKGLEDELKHQAFHDALSGLANRALFRDRLEHALARAARSLTSLAVLFLDLDDFKLVNDTLGHGAGDELLVAVAARLKGSLRTGDTAARFGGDEFAILLEETEDPEDACLVAERILADLRPPFMVEGPLHQRPRQHRYRLQQDRCRGPGRDPAGRGRGDVRGQGPGQELLRGLPAGLADGGERAARTDRRSAKGRRRGRVRASLPAHSQPGRRRVDRPSKHSYGGSTPNEACLLPKEFIPLAEETGLIIPIGRLGPRRGVQKARTWQQEHGLAGRLRISVNISARHFQHEGLVEDVSHALRRIGPRPVVPGARDNRERARA